MIFDGLFNQQQQSAQGESPYARMLEDPKFALGYGLLTSRENPLGAAVQVMGQGETARQGREDNKLKNMLLQAQLSKAQNPSAFAGTSMDAQAANLAYQDALNQGMDDFSARKYAADKIQTSKQTFGFDAQGRPIARSRNPIFGGNNSQPMQAPMSSGGDGYQTSFEMPVENMMGSNAPNIDGDIGMGELPPVDNQPMQQPPLTNQPNDINKVDTQSLINKAYAAVPSDLWAKNPRGAQETFAALARDIPEREKQAIGKQKFSEAINQLETLINEGATKGFLTSENQSTTQNITNRAFASDTGKTVAGYLGNDRATWLQKVDNIRSSITPIIQQSAGLGATQLNTPGETDRIMRQFADGTMTEQAAKDAIQKLKQREGMATQAPQNDMNAVEAEMRRRGLLK